MSPLWEVRKAEGLERGPLCAISLRLILGARPDDPSGRSVPPLYTRGSHDVSPAGSGSCPDKSLGRDNIKRMEPHYA